MSGSKAILPLLIALLGLSASFAQGLGPDASGALPPVQQPPWPDTIPGYTELDPDTGLHMTGKPQRISLEGYRLKITGAVERPLSLSYDEIRRLPRQSAKPALVCRGYFEDYANWSGASLAALLDLAGLGSSAHWIELVSADGYATNVTLAQARAPSAFLAYELEGRVLPVLHGFPLRAVFPALEGNNWVKWLVEIRVR
jgi:DMSO/TMAO reductase YedYZ molybdopterin-dependent catalytic subunit